MLRFEPVETGQFHFAAIVGCYVFHAGAAAEWLRRGGHWRGWNGRARDVPQFHVERSTVQARCSTTSYFALSSAPASTCAGNAAPFPVSAHRGRGREAARCCLATVRVRCRCGVCCPCFARVREKPGAREACRALWWRAWLVSVRMRPKRQACQRVLGFHVLGSLPALLALDFSAPH